MGPGSISIASRTRREGIAAQAAVAADGAYRHLRNASTASRCSSVGTVFLKSPWQRLQVSMKTACPESAYVSLTVAMKGYRGVACDLK